MERIRTNFVNRVNQFYNNEPKPVPEIDNESPARKELLLHVHAHHKTISMDFFKTQKNTDLLDWAHPNYRDFHKNRIRDEKAA